MGEKKKSNNVLEINVMMVGGRRCGKTSVLAALHGCFESNLADLPLTISAAAGATLDELEKKRQEVNEYFLRRGTQRTFVPDSNPNLDMLTYTFYISLKDSPDKIKINFIDFPGEWLRDRSHWDKLQDKMAKSRILLVAIDTPHLMEEKGLYNEQRNCCLRICEMVKSVGFADADKGAGMILLIPLKCERYRNDKRMEEVAMRTADAYQPLIQYVKQPGKNGEPSLCQVAVTPIFTMGGAAFEWFERDSDMEIIVDSQFKTPKSAVYYFPDMSKDKPEPLYCEQPLLYVLEFTFNAAQTVIRKGKNPIAKLPEILMQILKNAPVNPLFAVVVDFLAEGIAQWGGTEDYLEYAEAIRKRLKPSGSGDGYRVLVSAVPGGKH